MKDAPAFDFYPERWSHGTKHMTKVERCDYLDLLSQQWTNDGLPADLDILARILGYKKAAQIPAFVIEKFPVSDDGKRRNPRLEIERGKQRQRIEKRRDGAQKTNAKRWNSDSLSDRSATPQRPIVEGYSDSPPPTTHHSPIVLLEKEPKGEGSISPKRQGVEKDIKDADNAAIPLELQTQSFRDAWDDWCLHRAELYRRIPAKRWSSQAARNTLTECARHGADAASKAITSAIANGWQGLVWDRGNSPAKTFTQQDIEQRRKDRAGAEIITPKFL